MKALFIIFKGVSVVINCLRSFKAIGSLAIFNPKHNLGKLLRMLLYFNVFILNIKIFYSLDIKLTCKKNRFDPIFTEMNT